MRELKLPIELNLLKPAICDSLVRIGSKYDGGYVLPQEILRNIEVLISLGISIDWSFDTALKNINPNMSIHAYDHTISKEFFLKNALNGIFRLFTLRNGPRKCYEKFRLLNSYLKFFQNTNIHHQERVNNAVEASYDATVEKIFSRVQGKNNIFLKIDIEGSEYLVIEKILEYKNQILGLAIEFHETNKNRNIFLKLVNKLLVDFELIHLHANNCGSIGDDDLPDALELSFIAKNRVYVHGSRDELPIANLDFPNDPKKIDYKIIFAK